MRDEPLPVRRGPVRLLISLLACVAATVLVAACGGAPSATSKPAQPAGDGATPAATPLAAPVGQSVLPFEGLDRPGSIAVDTDGNVYVAEPVNHRVLKLPAGSTSQIVLPFPPATMESVGHQGERAGLVKPTAIAVDKAGNLYVHDCTAPGRVWKLPAGSNTPIVLFDGYPGDGGLAVDTAGNLYGISMVPGSQWFKVWKLAAPTTPNVTPAELPIADLQWPAAAAHIPHGIAVDREGNIYYVDAHPQHVADHRVVKISPDLAVQTVLPFSDLKFPKGIAVDSTGTVYVTEGLVSDTNKAAYPDAINRVLKLSPGSNTPTVLPFIGLNHAAWLTVRPIWMTGPTDSVYLSDHLNNRVLRLGLGTAP